MRIFLALALLISCTVLIFTASGCEINVNTNNCLECEYKHDGILYTRQLCDEDGTQAEKDDMRDDMQEEADSLGVQLECELR